MKPPALTFHQKALQAVVVEDIEKRSGGVPRTLTKDAMMEQAQHVAELAAGNTDAETVLNALFEYHASRGDIAAAELLRYAESQVMMMFYAHWAVDAFPQVVVGAKYAAALCATEVPEEFAEELRSPWPAWILEVPPGVLHATTAEGAPDPVRRIWVMFKLDRWFYWTTNESPASLFNHRMTASQMTDGSSAKINHEASCWPLEVTDVDQRAHVLIKRLIVGTCLAMTSPGNITRAPKEKVPAWRRREPGAPPIKGRTYFVGNPVKIDCRPAIREYLSGSRKSAPSVQHLVRGFWRRQPHGPGSSLRRLTWVEPYWRGPDEAPILTRPKQVGP